MHVNPECLCKYTHHGKIANQPCSIMYTEGELYCLGADIKALGSTAMQTKDSIESVHGLLLTWTSLFCLSPPHRYMVMTAQF